MVRRLEADAPVKVVAELSQRAYERDSEALEALARYARDGRLVGMRDHVVATLAKAATPNASFLEANFREWLQPTSPEGHQYWAQLGLINTLGSAAYPYLIGVVSNEALATDTRAHAVKLLAQHSGQTFDAGRPSDPGHWRIEDIEVARLSNWASSGYPKGTGYVLPITDPSLESPVTRLEKAASHLNQLLHKERQQKLDPANPSNMLVQASTETMAAIRSYFKLPSNYLEFLERFSPLNVIVESRRFINGLQLYGAGDLIPGQLGYSINAMTNEAIQEWPSTMIVIGNDGGDPYTLDLSRTAPSDAPVSRAPHGSGGWRFRQVAPSFIEFIEQLK